MGKLLNEFKKRKEGVVVGGLIGLGVALFIGSSGGDLNFAVQSVGLIDVVAQNAEFTKDLAFTKVGSLFILIGALVGGLVDNK